MSRLSKTVIIRSVVLDLDAGKYLHTGDFGSSTQAVTLRILEFWPECGLVDYHSDTITVLVAPYYNGCTQIPNIGDTCLVYAYNHKPRDSSEGEYSYNYFTTTRFCSGFISKNSYPEFYSTEIDSLGRGYMPNPGLGNFSTKKAGNQNANTNNAKVESAELNKSQNVFVSYLLVVSVLLNLVLFLLYLTKGKLRI